MSGSLWYKSNQSMTTGRLRSRCSFIQVWSLTTFFSLKLGSTEPIKYSLSDWLPSCKLAQAAVTLSGIGAVAILYSMSTPALSDIDDSWRSAHGSSSWLSFSTISEAPARPISR